MDPWTSLIGPAVVAAAISGLVSGIGIWISARTSRRIHTEKLAFDRDEAERRAAAEIALAERKVNADISLAEKKLTLDRALATWKRRTEFAEEVLADFYRARDIINAARSPGSFSDEGATREKAAWETESDTRTLNAYFAAIERLANNREFFAQLLARRYRFLALFSSTAANLYDDIFKVQIEIRTAVQMLIMTYPQRDLGSLPTDRREWQAVIWDTQSKDDPIPSRLNRIIEGIEAICRPVIQEAAP